MNPKFGYCHVSLSPIRDNSSDTSEMVSQMVFGEPIEILSVHENWYKIKTILDQYEGWVDTKHIDPLTENEKNNWLKTYAFQLNKTLTIDSENGKLITTRGSFISKLETKFKIGNNNYHITNSTEEKLPTILDLAANYLNTPYLWGGKSPFGIDCSGFVQSVFRFYNIFLPRDAKDQILGGESISVSNIKEGDLAFFENKDGKIIHVGILDGRNKIIHASGWVRWDHFDENGITNSKTGQLTHKLSDIKRYIIEK